MALHGHVQASSDDSRISRDCSASINLNVEARIEWRMDFVWPCSYEIERWMGKSRTQ